MSMNNSIKGVYTRGNMIKMKFKHCSDDVRDKLFQSFCTTFYCCATWSNFSRKSYSSVNVCHNNVFRSVCQISGRGSISRQFIVRNIPNFDVIQRKCAYSLFRRFNQSDNDLVVSLTNSLIFVQSTMFKRWMSILF